jgi:hypothetical protein
VTNRRIKPAPPALAPACPKVIETYREPWLRDVAQTEPSAYNGMVRIRRYRVTVELIEEPVEVLRDRLRKLWREDEKNHHHWAPMRTVAKELGMDPDELKHEEHGIDHPRRKP